jgi:hypothetical protein
MMGRVLCRSAGILVLLAGVLGGSTAAFAHALQPGYLELRKIDQELYAAL